MDLKEFNKNRILEKIEIDKDSYKLKDAYRYLKIKKDELDKDLDNRIKSNFEKILEISDIKHYGEFRKLEIIDDSNIRLGELKINSAGLRKNLKNSAYVYIFGVTLGLGVDRLIHRLSIINSADSLIADAIASDIADGCADIINSRVNIEVKKNGYKTYPRFSPGFLDYDLFNQKELIKSLDLNKIGISTTDSGMMVPTKSVTAIIGITRNDKE